MSTPCLWLPLVLPPPPPPPPPPQLFPQPWDDEAAVLDDDVDETELELTELEERDEDMTLEELELEDTSLLDELELEELTSEELEVFARMQEGDRSFRELVQDMKLLAGGIRSSARDSLAEEIRGWEAGQASRDAYLRPCSRHINNFAYLCGPVY